MNQCTNIMLNRRQRVKLNKNNLLFLNYQGIVIINNRKKYAIFMTK